MKVKRSGARESEIAAQLWDLVRHHRRKEAEALARVPLLKLPPVPKSEVKAARSRARFHRLAAKTCERAAGRICLDYIEAAADFIQQFDPQVDHPYRLSDCLRLKFNRINKRQVRKTPARKKA